ncbi:MAG TPA: potassium channel family protein [Gemmata sp.]|nr:potassium channel family protein [Gemmata sp.]
MPRLTTRKYQALLLALLGLVVVYPLLGGTPHARLVLHLLVTFVFAAALVVVFAGHRLRVAAFLLGLPTLVGMWTGYFLPGVPTLAAQLTFHMLAAGFFAFTTGAILRDIYREKGVSVDSVYGAFCGYFLTGLAFGHVYNVVELLHPGSFRGEDFAADMSDDHRHYLLTYFSFLTLTTVGYGDVTPATSSARGLAVTEAITGQFYLAVLVAELIGRRVSQAFAPPEK